MKFDSAVNELRDEIVRLWHGEAAAGLGVRFHNFNFMRTQNIDKERAFVQYV
jgi:hypothetical protein